MQRGRNPEHRICVPDESEYEQLLHFTCEQFLAGSVLHQNVRIEPEDYIRYMRNAFYRMAECGIVLCAKSETDSTLAGCLLAGDFLDEPAVSDTTPQLLEHISALLLALEQRYISDRTIEPGEVLKIDIAVVAPQARGLGLYKQMRLKAQEIGSERGFRHVLGELSSGAAQQLCVHKLGHQVLSEIMFDSFEHRGEYPFAHIQQPPSIQLVQGACR